MQTSGEENIKPINRPSSSTHRMSKQDVRDEMLYWIAKHLPTTLAGETRLSNKEAHLFATDFINVVKMRFDGTHDG